MVVNSCLEDMEGRMRLKSMWKLGAQVGKKEEQMSGGEQRFWILGVSLEVG